MIKRNEWQIRDRGLVNETATLHRQLMMVATIGEKRMMQSRVDILRRTALVLANALNCVEVGSLEYFDLVRLLEKTATELRRLGE
ncbi:hypothetical protein AS156_27760 [Bradyrhizobium macuxiense]|uniref:Uncharacterized protein n=1 Tax=Bradyrhizobium macuxiense TaxID=1755647 RepID=A0A120FRY5_9BRAD|nr:hypothetical protein AS156_27760 [Bradyrhizobium macuxiense]